MFSLEKPLNYDYIIHERIHILEKQGYCGFTISAVREDSNSREFLVEAKKHNIILTTKGHTKEEALKKMIDLIDLTVDDY